MKAKILTYIFVLPLLAAMLGTLYISDTSKMGIATYQDDLNYCDQIRRDYFKKKCFKNFLENEQTHCQSLKDNALKSSCLEELAALKKRQEALPGNIWVVVIEFTLVLFLARYLMGDMYFEVFERFYKKPLLGIFLQKMNQLATPGAFPFLRIIVTVAAYILFLVGDYWITLTY